MKRFFDLLDVCLALFDGGAAPAAAAPATAEADGAKAGLQADPGSSRRGSKGVLAQDQRSEKGGQEKVLYGKQAAMEAPASSDPDAGGQTKEEPALTPEERRAKFRALVGGEYKDVYTEETQGLIDRRFRETKTIEEALNAQKPVLDMLMQRYKIADGDVSKLERAVEQDDSYWTRAAEEAGMEVDQYRQWNRLQRENEALRQQQAQMTAKQLSDQQCDKWMREAEEVRGTYGDFDLDVETQNPDFLALLKTGVPVRHAYEVLHLDAIKGGVAQQTAHDTEKRVVDGIKAKGTRPVENGVSAQNGITLKSDVSKLNFRDREEIARRAARGEKIEF